MFEGIYCDRFPSKRDLYIFSGFNKDKDAIYTSYTIMYDGAD